MKEKKINIYPVMVFLSGILWGSMGLFVNKLNDKGCTSRDIVVLRAGVTAAVMAIVLLIKDRRAFVVRLKDLWVFLGTGICSVVFFNLCYFTAIVEVGMSVAAVMLYTAPAFVMLMSGILFGERITGVKIVSLALAILGCFFVSDVFEGAGSLNVAGLLAGLGAGFGYALYSIFSRFAINKGYSSMTITFYTFLFAAIGSVVISNPVEAYTTSFDSISGAMFSLLFVLASTVLPYLLYTKGLSGTENGRASIIAAIEPVSATVLGFLFFGQVPSFYGFVGMILVLLGVVVSNMGISNSHK